MEDLKIVERCLDGLLKIGFEKASVHCTTMDKSELNVEINETKLLRNAKELTLSLTGIIDQKRGSIAINKLDTESIHQAIQDVYGIAKSSMADPAYDISENQGQKSYEFGPQSPDMDLIYDRNQEFLEHAQANYPNVILNTILDHTLRRHVYANSNDVLLQSNIGAYNGDVFFVTKEGQSSSSLNGTGFQSNTLEDEVHLLASVTTLLQQSSEQTETQMLPEKFVGDVIITPDCHDFLSFIHGQITDYPLISGTSMYKDKLNESIADSQLTIHSQPVSPDLAGGYFITDDGFEAKNATIVDQGVLQHFLLSNYGAKKTGKTIGPNRGGSIVVEPGKQRYEDMVQSVKQGLLLCRFSGGNPTPNGDFSGVAKNSYYIQEGQIQFPLSETMVAGNITEIFQSMKGISQERINFGSDRVPWIHVTGVTVSGQ